MKRLIYILFLFLVTSVVAQNDGVENYKYVIVDSNFDFVKKRDAYRTSSMTKFLFNKIGFEAYLNDETLPRELAVDKCKALFAKVVDESGSLSIKSVIEIRDCTGKVIFTSNVGKSKIKNYERGYYQSISEAFKSVQLYKYKFDKVPQDNSSSIVFKSKRKEADNVVVNKKENQLIKEDKVNLEAIDKFVLLYAKADKSGYQLLDKENNIVFIILKTNDKNKYFIKGKNGTFTKSNDHVWIAEYYQDEELITKNYVVKF